MLKKWNNLPANLRIVEVRPYYDVLKRKRLSLLIKRLFDIIASLVLLLLLLLPMTVISVWIVLDSKGPIIYRQKRITTYGKPFRIHKFRTMVSNADQIGTAVTVNGDSRITRAGRVLRRFRLDELPQLLDVLVGNMTFVGTRPEVERYVQTYRPEYLATLLLPAGITSEASIRYKNEEKLLRNTDDADRVYIEQVLPAKMKWNLRSLQEFSLWFELLVMLRTVAAMLGKNYEDLSEHGTDQYV